MSTETDLQQVEISIEQARNNIKRMQTLDRLKNNKDFEEIILEGYFRNEASRVVLLKADPEMQEDKHQKQLNKMIDGIGYLRQYLNTIYQFGHISERTLQQDLETRTELMQEA